MGGKPYFQSKVTKRLKLFWSDLAGDSIPAVFISFFVSLHVYLNRGLV